MGLPVLGVKGLMSCFSDTPIKRPVGATLSNKTPEATFQRKSGSVIKRIAPLTPSTKGNEYSTNGSVSKITKGIRTKYLLIRFM